MAEAVRRLWLLRHAKSSWDDATLADFDRPLAPRGRAAAPRVAAWMAARTLLPDLVICSAARRTRETWDLVAPILAGRPDVTFSRDVYEAPADRLLAVLRAVPDAARAVLLVGHNPGMSDLAQELAGAGSDRGALGRLRRKFPTGAVALLESSAASWAELGVGTCRLTGFVRPKDLPEGAGQSQKRDEPA